MFGQDCMWDCTWKNKFPSTFDVFYGFSDVFCRKYISDALHSTVMLKSSIETVDIFCPQPILSFCQNPFLLELEGKEQESPLADCSPYLIYVLDLVLVRTIVGSHNWFLYIYYFQNTIKVSSAVNHIFVQ